MENFLDFQNGLSANGTRLVVLFKLHGFFKAQGHVTAIDKYTLTRLLHTADA